MILEKVKTLSSAFSKTEIDKSLLGFDPEPDIEMIKDAIKKGRWSTLIFETNEKYKSMHGFRISPTMQSQAWPVYVITQYNASFLYAPNILAFIVFRHLRFLKANRKDCISYKEDWENRSKSLLTYYRYFGGTDDLKELTDIIFDEAKWPDESSFKLSVEDYIEFMKKHDNPEAVQFLVDLVSAINEDDSFLPDSPSIDAGIWTTRILNIIGVRSYALSVDIEYAEVERKMFDCFLQPHGFDAESLSPNVMPDDSTESSYQINDLANSDLTIPDNDQSEVILNSPEYKALLAIQESGEGYTGLEHIEAAAILDSEMNQPMRAWNCLLSAGYWAGMNKPELQETIMEAAIYLCRKHKWTEAADAVQYNLDIYKSA